MNIFSGSALLFSLLFVIHTVYVLLPCSIFGPFSNYQGLLGLSGSYRSYQFTIHLFPRANRNNWGRLEKVYEDDEDGPWVIKSFDLGPFFSCNWSRQVE